MNDSKPDQGLPLTPSRAADLILELVPRDVWFGKREIIELTRPVHLERGGVDGGRPEATYKKALGNLRKQGRIEFNGGRNVGAKYKVTTSPDARSSEPLRPVEETDRAQADGSLKGLPLACADAKKMILSLEPLSEWHSRREVTAMVVAEYRRCGGTEATTTSESLVKLALSQLRDEGRVEMNGSGSGARWRTFRPQKLPASIPEPNEAVPSASLAASRAVAPDESIREKIDKFSGNARESDGYIYVIYERRMDASTPRRGNYAVRIGMSNDKSSLNRVKQHIESGISIPRRCGLVYYTRAPRQYETVYCTIFWPQRVGKLARTTVDQGRGFDPRSKR